MAVEWQTYINFVIWHFTTLIFAINIKFCLTLIQSNILASIQWNNTFKPNCKTLLTSRKSYQNRCCCECLRLCLRKYSVAGSWRILNLALAVGDRGVISMWRICNKHASAFITPVISITCDYWAYKYCKTHASDDFRRKSNVNPL